MIQIHKAGVRQGLAPRREPYWTRVQRGQYIGFRKMPVSQDAAKAGREPSETWIARYRSEDREQKYKSLNYVSDMDFDTAKKAAEQAKKAAPAKKTAEKKAAAKGSARR